MRRLRRLSGLRIAKCAFVVVAGSAALVRLLILCPFFSLVIADRFDSNLVDDGLINVYCISQIGQDHLVTINSEEEFDETYPRDFIR